MPKWFEKSFIKILGAKTVKLGFVLGHTFKPVNSLANFTIIAAYNGDEKPNQVYAAFKSIATQIDNLRQIDIKGEEYEFEKYEIYD